ncbi:hypothetical protein AMJ57_02865 [Parcubacteria bacterium SG8_24]|nr:MAG: hypothetical protein AMJ57_02865 [Parcubacteria bacterium SG8_24]
MMEALIAIGIVITAISSAMTVVQGSIKGEKESEITLVAANLAREGIEVVRAIRDTNWQEGDPWDDGLEGAGFDYTGIPVFDPAANAWSIDFSVDAPSAPEAAVYRYTTGNGGITVGLFVQALSQPAGSVRTSFRRLLSLDAICDAGGGTYEIRTSGDSCATEKVGIRVTSHVEWMSSVGSIRSVDFEERIFDWR